MLTKLTTRWFDPDQNKHPHHEIVLRLNFVWTFFSFCESGTLADTGEIQVQKF